MNFDFYNKANARPEISLLLIILLISSVAAFQGVSSSYTSDTKFDFGLTDNSTSSSFTGRIISGFEAVGDYVGSGSSGRFGVLEDVTTSLVIGSVSINTTDGTNRTGQELNCFATVTEPNGGALNVTVKWYNSSVEFSSVNYNDNYANGSLFSESLASSSTLRGENWSCALRTFNGIIYSNWSLSDNITIVNSPPNITLDYPSNGGSTMNLTPEFNWTGVDDDGDIILYDFNLSLVPASLCTEADQFVENITSENYTASTVGCYFDNGDYYIWSVRGKDNYSTGEWADYFNLSLSMLIDLSFPTSSVNFGDIPFLGSDNTSDDSPAPFVIQNNGNTLVNINISSDDLWDAVGNPTPYYRLKVDNVSGEEGAFNWSASSVDWENAPAGNNTLFISRLDYNNSKDSAELEIYVEVPLNETPSAKSSTITFVGGLVS